MKEINILKIQEGAENSFKAGDFYCSEAIMNSFRNNFDNDMPESVVAMASGFPVGIGKTKCLCGAVSGGVMALGYFLGRTKGKDEQVNVTLRAAAELQNSFKANHGCTCCKVLTKGFDMASGEHKKQCVAFTGEMARKAAEIIAKELDLKVIK